MSKCTRKDFILITGAAAAFTWVPAKAASYKEEKAEKKMYGLIGKINTTPGIREKLIEILLEGVAGMPGCLSYIVAKDSEDADAIWVTEIWDSKESHEASLSIPSVQEAITRGRPFIAGFSERFQTNPVGGIGLKIDEAQ